MPTEFSVNKRDIQFVLYEQVDAERLCALAPFEDFNKEVFDMVLDEAVKLGTDVLAPINASGDREGCQFEDGQVRTPKGFKEAVGKVAEGGWAGLIGNPEYGGQGFPSIMKAVAMEVFSGANSPISLFANVLTEGAAHMIERSGTEEQRRLYCEKLYSGEWGGTMCLTEPSAGSDVGALSTTAKPNGDHYLISGTKIFITNGDHDLTPNIIHPVLARIEGAPSGTGGISLFIVPKFLVDDKGAIGDFNDVRCSGIEHKMGIKGSPTCVLNFGDDGACKGWLLGEPNKGMRVMFQMMNEARLEVGLGGFGIAAASYLSALGYAQERKQGVHFSKARDKSAPKAFIIEHPDVRRMLLHMKSMTDGMRSMLYAVASYIDLAEHADSEEDRVLYSALVELLTPVCKSYCSDMGFRVNEMAIQVYGGYGYCQEYPVEQYCRDNKIASLYEGTNGIQALDLLGRKVLRTKGAYVKAFAELIGGLIDTHVDVPIFHGPLRKLAGAKDSLLHVTEVLIETMPKDPAGTMLWATPYQEMFGHIALAYYLLDGAVIAMKKLADTLGGSIPNDDAVLGELLRENTEAAFYHGRIASALFFAHTILPQTAALASAILSEDRSALAIEYPG